VSRWAAFNGWKDSHRSIIFCRPFNGLQCPPSVIATNSSLRIVTALSSTVWASSLECRNSIDFIGKTEFPRATRAKPLPEARRLRDRFRPQRQQFSKSQSESILGRHEVRKIWGLVNRGRGGKSGNRQISLIFQPQSDLQQQGPLMWATFTVGGQSSGNVPAPVISV